MDTGLTVVVVLVVLAVVAAVALLLGYGRHYRRIQQDIEAAEYRYRAGASPPGTDLPGGGWHGPSASGGFPAVGPATPEQAIPAQRTGEHDQDQSPAPTRRGRLLRRHG